MKPARTRWPLWRILLWGMVALLLILPAVAMLFTRQVNWGVEDFAAAAVLLIGGATAYELATRVTADGRKRLALGAVILAIVALVGAQAMVGVFD
jgi:hypothetical protein